jgi:hypothetical protein
LRITISLVSHLQSADFVWLWHTQNILFGDWWDSTEWCDKGHM